MVTKKSLVGFATIVVLLLSWSANLQAQSSKKAGRVWIVNNTDRYVTVRVEDYWLDKNGRKVQSPPSFLKWDFAPKEDAILQHQGKEIIASEFRYKLISARGVMPAKVSKYKFGSYLKISINAQDIGLTKTKKKQQPRWIPGKMHSTYLHVIASKDKGKWTPASGYTWLNSKAGDFRVKSKTVGSTIVRSSGSSKYPHVITAPSGKKRKTGLVSVINYTKNDVIVHLKRFIDKNGRTRTNKINWCLKVSPGEYWGFRTPSGKPLYASKIWYSLTTVDGKMPESGKYWTARYKSGKTLTVRLDDRFPPKTSVASRTRRTRKSSSGSLRDIWNEMSTAEKGGAIVAVGGVALVISKVLSSGNSTSGSIGSTSTGNRDSNAKGSQTKTKYVTLSGVVKKWTSVTIGFGSPYKPVRTDVFAQWSDAAFFTSKARDKTDFYGKFSVRIPRNEWAELHIKEIRKGYLWKGKADRNMHFEITVKKNGMVEVKRN